MNPLPPLALREAEVIAIARQALQSQQWPYDAAFGLQPTWRGPTEHVVG